MRFDRTGQIPIQVEVISTGNVRRLVLLESGIGLHQVKAAICDRDVWVVEMILEPGRRDDEISHGAIKKLIAAFYVYRPDRVPERE